MKNTPFFSIIIPTFNRASFLDECVKNILAQSFSDFEIIISDNHSDDDTPLVVNQFRDQRIRHFRQDKNIGASGNIAFLGEQVRGKYLVLHQDDDLIHRDFLKRCHQCVSLTPDITVYGAPLWLDSRGTGYCPTRLKEGFIKDYPYYYLSDEVIIFDGKESATNFLYYYFINPPAVAICADTFRKIGGYYINTAGGGTDIITESRALLHGNFAFDPRPGGMYRKHADNFCKSRKVEERSEAIRTIFERIISDFEDAGFDWQAVVRDHLYTLPWKQRFRHFRRWVRHQAPVSLQQLGWDACRSDRPGKLNSSKIIAHLGVRNAYYFLRDNK